MTVVQLSTYEYVGLSTDAKPTTGVHKGAHFTESDTGLSSVYNGTSWLEIHSVAIAFEHMQIHLGKMWNISHLWEEVADGASADLVITVGSETLHTVYLMAAEGAAFIKVYEAPTTSGGTAATVRNANRITGDAGAPVAVYDPTVSVVGTLLRDEYMPGGGGGNAPGGQANRQVELDLVASTKYLFRMTNDKGNAADMSWLLLGYEHD